MIDKICGELIYPRNYIIEKFFNGDPSSKPITNKERLGTTFWNEMLSQTYALSPKGLAKAMRDTDLTTVNSELYKYLSTELHEKFRKSCINYSTYGHMNINFSDVQAVLDFYKYIEVEIRKTRYPLFQKIKKDLLSNELSSADFADTFAMKLEDAHLIKAIWSQQLHDRASK